MIARILRTSFFFLDIERRNRIFAFHWTDQPRKLRAIFLRESAKLSFSAKVAVFRNPINEVKALEWALKHVLVEKNFRLIILDGKKPKLIERQLKKVLRDNGVSVKNLKPFGKNHRQEYVLRTLSQVQRAPILMTRTEELVQYGSVYSRLWRANRCSVLWGHAMR